MATMTISSKGQMVLPVDIRRRFGLRAGAKIEVIEEADGLKLVAAHVVNPKSIADCAGMVTAPSIGKTRSLDDFDAATYAAKGAK